MHPCKHAACYSLQLLSSVKSNHMRKYFSVWITSPDGLESWCPNISWHCPFKPENFLGAQSHSEPCHFITFLLLIEGQARTGLLSNLTWIKVNLSSNPAAYWPTAVLAPTCGQFPAQHGYLSKTDICPKMMSYACMSYLDAFQQKCLPYADAFPS